MKDWHRMRAWVECDKQYYYLSADLSFWFDEDLEAQYDVGDLPEYELESCTGLKDKNGKLIYEGDILSSHHFNSEFLTHIVERNPRTGIFHANNKDHRFEHGQGSPLLWVYVDQNIGEIIGNIHTTPELT
jgi:uncharacterized phage protein (TIGR01671 family)